jgi:transcription elongation GreA/GreB family factor
VNKSGIVKKIIDALSAEFAVYAKAARAAHLEATHEQSRAENKYDTRGLEAAYLARGQSKQAAEIEQSIEYFQKLSLKSFVPENPIDVTALVELEGNGETNFYFVASRAGGTEIVQARKTVLVITPQSPLGQQLVGKKQGDRLQLEIARTQHEYRIVKVT